MSLMKSNKRPSKKPQLYDNYLIIATCVNCLIMRSCIGLTLSGALRRREAPNLSCRPGRGRGREKKPFVQRVTESDYSGTSASLVQGQLPNLSHI